MNLVEPLVTAHLRLPEHPGKLRLERWLARCLPREGVVSTTSAGVRLRLHPHDWIERLLLRGEAYEPLTLAFLRANLRAGDRAALAGVNFGLHVIVAARAVGAGGRVLGIEPQPTLLTRALGNLALNDVPANVTFAACALGEASGMVPMPLPPRDNSGKSTLIGGDAACPLRVPVATLPEVLAGAGLGAPRLFLLDVEGYEWPVLRGLGSECRPDLLVVEVEPRILATTGVTASAMYDLIQGLGYRTHDLHGQPATASTVAELPEHNLVCAKAGVTPVFVGR